MMQDPELYVTSFASHTATSLTPSARNRMEVSTELRAIQASDVLGPSNSVPVSFNNLEKTKKKLEENIYKFDMKKRRLWRYCSTVAQNFQTFSLKLTVYIVLLRRFVPFSPLERNESRERKHYLILTYNIWMFHTSSFQVHFHITADANLANVAHFDHSFNFDGNVKDNACKTLVFRWQEISLSLCIPGMSLSKDTRVLFKRLSRRPLTVSFCS